MEGFLTTNEVALECGVSRQRVHQWRTTRGLTAIRAGYVWLYPVESVRMFVRKKAGRPPRKCELIAS